MTRDHVDLDRLLIASWSTDGIDQNAYERFRERLRQHIAMEEKVLMPFARAKQGTPLAMAADLRRDHALIAKLLARSPNAFVVASLRHVLSTHNILEEGPDGLYAACDALAGDEADEIVTRLGAQPAVSLAKYYDGPEHRLAKA